MSEMNRVEKSKKLFIIFILSLTTLNTIAIFTVGTLLFNQKQKELKTPAVKDFSLENQEKETNYAIPLDYFLVNLAEDSGLRQFKVQMEFDVNNSEVLKEINQRMPQIRDTNIILLSSLSYQQISTPQGKVRLKEQIRDTVNSYLTKGEINKVLFTHFIYN